MPEMLKLEGISFSYPNSQPVLRDFSLKLSAGEILTLTGPAGSGKTTLLKLIIKELVPDTGVGYFLGKPLFGSSSFCKSELRRNIGVLGEKDLLLPARDVFDNLAVSLRFAGLSEQKLKKRITKSLVRVGLIGKAKSRASILSSTEKRLLDLARVLAMSPPLIVVDSDSSDLDQQLMTTCLKEHARYGGAVLILTRNVGDTGRQLCITGGGDDYRRDS